MKPWNKIKWQKESAKLANKPLDDFDAYMKEICELHGVRRWDCISQNHKTEPVAPVCTCDVLSVMGGVMLRYKSDCPNHEHAAIAAR
jgi:hypothetical protein